MTPIGQLDVYHILSLYGMGQICFGYIRNIGRRNLGTHAGEGHRRESDLLRGWAVSEPPHPEACNGGRHATCYALCANTPKALYERSLWQELYSSANTRK